MKILLLEDDYNLAEVIQEILLLENYQVDISTNSKEVYQLTYQNRYDLYIFDINLGNENGLDILKSLRDANDNTPTIYITAISDLNTMAKAFKIGADDYIKKPFEVEELLIRIKAKFNKSIKTDGFEYNYLNKELKKDDKIISLGYISKEIFHTLITNKNQLVTKNELLDILDTTNETSLRVHINKLKKLGLNIRNIRGEGYIIEI